MSRDADVTDARGRPYFFLSYAHTPSYSPGMDPDLWVHRLFQDLSDHVMAMTDHPAGHPVGFMARQMRLGESWSERLAVALANCRVFVPLYSPRYFRSDMCGKEWYAFSRRVTRPLMRQATAAAIVPALWVPVRHEDLPPAARDVYADHRAFGEDYATEGLYGLMKLRYLRDEYERAVYQLAKAIVTTAERRPSPAGRPLDIDEVPSAFEPRTGSRRLRIVVAALSTRHRLPPGRSADCYGPSAVDWNPYRAGVWGGDHRPLAEVAAEEVRRLDYLPTIEPLGEAAAEPLTGEQPDGPAVVLLDRWALADAEQRELLARMDLAARPWVSVIVPWDRSDPDDPASGDELQQTLEKTLARTLQRGRSVSRVATSGVPSPDAFADVLPTLIQWAAAQFVRYAPVHPPEGPAVARPRLRGPLPGMPGPVEEAADDRRP